MQQAQKSVISHLMEFIQPHHGGDLDAAAQLYGIAPGAWLDLSTGVNPLSYPVPELDAALWRRLPDREMIAQLEQAAHKAYGADQQAGSLASAGSATLIHRLPYLMSNTRVHIAGPTFAEHQAAWANAGHDVHLVQGARIDEATVMVVVNPNNPDGQIYRPDDLVRLAETLNARGGFLVVDEAFADPHPDLSVSSEAGRPGLVVLRSFGKFFGLAGLRLGFALAAPEVIARLRGLVGPWPVSGPATQIGIQALRDEGWISSERHRLEAAAARMQRLLADCALTTAGGCALFTLLDVPDADSLHHQLARQGIWTRLFPEQPGWLRLGMPGLESDWQRLETAIHKCCRDRQPVNPQVRSAD